MGNQKIKDGEESINRIKLLMVYDMTKTLNENLSEQSVIGAPANGTVNTTSIPSEKSTNKPKEVNNDIWPIPGYKTYYTPKPNDIKGGTSYMYFPLDIESNITLWDFALPNDFPDIQKKESKSKVWWKPLTAQHLSKILPMGSVRNFSIDGIQYLTSLNVTEKTNGYWVFKGYVANNGKYYESPNPEHYKSEWDKFVEEYGTAFQIILSVMATIIIEVLTAGTGTALAVKLLYEVMAELAINIPIAAHELKKGDNFGAGLSIIFSFLPFLNIKILPKFSKNLKSISEEMAKKIASANITDGAGLARFYDGLETDAEKYILSRVLKQSPEVIEKSFKNFIKNIFEDPNFNKKMLRKIAFKDRLWWKDAGIQISVALSLIGLKLKFGSTFSREEYKRMNDFVVSVLNVMGENEGHQLIAKTYENPKLTDSLINIAISDTLSPDFKILAEKIAENAGYDPSETAKKLYRAKLDSIKKSKIKISPDVLDSYDNINHNLDDNTKDTIK